MYISKRAATLIGAVSLTFSGSLLAQDTGETTLDPNLFNMYLESRLQQPADQATAQQIEAVRSELMDIYALSDAPRAKELQSNPSVQARIELQTRSMLAQAVAMDFLAQNPASEEEMQAVYDEQTKLAPPLEFKARHILVETQGEATEIIVQLDDGADFVELAKEKSTGPSGPSGGDLGWFPPDRMVPEFSQAVEAMDDGAYTKAPVQTQFGWHVILREESRETAPPPYESVKDTLKQQVEGQKLQAYIESLRG